MLGLEITVTGPIRAYSIEKRDDASTVLRVVPSKRTERRIDEDDDMVSLLMHLKYGEPDVALESAYDSGDTEEIVHQKRKRTHISRSRYAPWVRQVLNNWISAHWHDPYPTHGEKASLSAKTGLSTTQVNNWMANARRRKMAKRPGGLRRRGRRARRNNGQGTRKQKY